MWKLIVFTFVIQWSDVIAAAKPNVLMIVMDDLGWNDTSYKGSDIPTPTIDKFANEGVRLQQYYVQRLCSPTRSAIMTGRYPYHLGLASGVIIAGHPYGMPLNQTTLANELKKGGYATHIVGKWHLGMCKWEYTPTYRGFDSFYGYYNGMQDYFNHNYTVRGTDYGGIDFRNGTKPVTNKRGDYSTNMFTEEIERIINKHDEEKRPFFIYATYQAVHAPLEAPQKYFEKCQSIPYEGRRTFCAMLRAADEGISNITMLLKEKNLLDNTIIIFTTDNGGETGAGSSNWPLRGNKATVLEGGVRGTAFVWGSKLPKLNYDNMQLIHATDWLPTIVEGIAGLELDKNRWALDGYNMWPTITSNSETPRKEILINLDPPRPGFVGQAAIRVGDWKLITGRPNCSFAPVHKGSMCPDGWVHLDGSIELPPYTPSLTWLFNLTADPNERNNVADMYPEVVNQLKERIEYYNSTHIAQINVPIDPKSNPDNFDGIWTPWLD